jgi:hypothetical protein
VVLLLLPASEESGVAGDGEREAVAVADDEDIVGEPNSEQQIRRRDYIATVKKPA